jgi:hypothetical protein
VSALSSVTAAAAQRWPPICATARARQDKDVYRIPDQVIGRVVVVGLHVVFHITHELGVTGSAVDLVADAVGVVDDIGGVAKLYCRRTVMSYRYSTSG